MKLTAKLISTVSAELEDLVSTLILFDIKSILSIHFSKCRFLAFSGKNGIAINLVDSEKNMEVCREIEKHFGKKIHLLDAEDSDEIEKIGS